MQRLTLNIPVGSFSPGDGFRVFGDVDALGRRMEAIDYDRPLSGESPVLFWPLTPVVGHLEGKWLEGNFLGEGEKPLRGHLEGTWLGGNWLGQPAEAPPDREVITPLLFFGWYLFAVLTYDLIGNASSGDPQTRRAFINSGPQPPRRFRQTGVADGRPVFGFDQPPQLAAQ